MVYEPREDSYLLENSLTSYVKNKSVLDMGSGSGILAKTALKLGANNVICADIDKEAVKELKKQNLKAIQSDLFSKIEEKFDIILFNPPYLPLDERESKESQRQTTGGKEGDEIILKFLKSSKKHLNKNGKILLLLSSLTPRKRINLLLNKLNMSKKTIAQENHFMEKLEVWLITFVT